MDLIDLDRRALAVFRCHLAATPRSRLGDPTPCPDWGVRDLATAALDVVATYPPEVWGRPQSFADRVPAPPGVPPHVRLVTTLGRRADWRPGAA